MFTSSKQRAIQANTVEQGRDGWLFLVGGTNSVIDLYDTPSSFNDDMAERWVRLLQDRHDCFQARGIEYLHLGAPEKLTVLSQHYLGTLPDIDGSPIMQLAQHHGHRVPCLLNVVPYLRRQSDEYPIYWKTDTHWSAWGSFLAYQQLCARLGLPTRTDLLSYPHHEGEIAMDLGAKMDPVVTENIRFYRFDQQSRRVYANPLVRYKEQGGFRNDGALHVGSNVIFRNDSPSADPRTVVLFGDSFSEYRNHLLTGMLAETVRELHFVWSSNIDHEYVRRVRPDIVITELAERFMTVVPKDDVDIDSLARDRIKAHSARSVESLEQRRSFVKRTPVHESETRELAAPLVVQDDCVFSQRDTHTVSSPVEVIESHNVSVYFNGLRCLARAPAGEEIARYGVDQQRAARVATEEYRSLPGSSLLLADSPGAHCYYHWMLDVLPKLGLLRQAGIDLSRIDHFLVREITTDFQRETLSTLGIPSERIVETLNDQYLHCEKLLHVPLLHHANMSMHSDLPVWLQDTFSAQTDHEDRIKLYISRPAGVRRGVENEAELLPILKAHGFESHAMEGLSVAEQASLLSRAKTIVSPHGGALTNMVFAARGASVLELFGRHVYPFYYGLAHTCGHRYMALMQRPDLDFERLVRLDEARRFSSADIQATTRSLGFRVDPVVFERALQQLDKD